MTAHEGPQSSLPGTRGGRTHSRISKVKRRFNFMPAAPKIVRMDRAVRPFHYPNGNFFRDVHQCLRDIFDQLFHHPASLTSYGNKG
jgi:hypothetical protein